MTAEKGTAKWYVYELWCPFSGEIFYVGKGTGNRCEKHHKYIDSTAHNLKSNKIRKILREGKTPIIRKVFYTNTEQEAFNKEIELIQFYGKRINGTGSLVNITDGGTGGDTVTGTPEENIRKRYIKRANTMSRKTEKEKQNTSEKRSASIKRTWNNNRKDWTNNIGEGIRKNRDKELHAAAVSKGWAARSEADKKRTAKKKSEIQKLAWQDPDKKKNLLKGSLAISIKTKIVRSDQSVIVVESLHKWCINNEESYSALEHIRRTGIKPKTPRSRYFGWDIITLKE